MCDRRAFAGVRENERLTGRAAEGGNRETCPADALGPRHLGEHAKSAAGVENACKLLPSKSSITKLMDPVAKFERALEGLKQETRKKYLRAARNAIEAIGDESGTNESVSELAQKLQHQSLILEPSKRDRIS